MVIHIGIIPHEGKIAVYDTETKTEFFDLLQTKVNPSDPFNVTEMFDEILSKIKPNRGCACLSVNSQFNDETKAKLIEAGREAGFEKVDVINFKEAILYEIINQTNLQLIDGNILWIINGKDCYIWWKEQQNVHFIKKLEHVYYTDAGQIQSIKNDSTVASPNFLLYNNQNEIDVNLVQSVFPVCNLLPYEYAFGQNESKGALIKARMMANDIQSAHNVTF